MKTRTEFLAEFIGVIIIAVIIGILRLLPYLAVAIILMLMYKWII